MNATPQNQASIRQAEPEDILTLTEFIRPFVTSGRLLPRTETELQELIAHGFLAVQNEIIVGFAALEIYSSKLAEIRSLAVANEVQGQGIGRLLVQSCVDRAHRENILEVLAITSEENFFQACGFDFTLPGEKKALFLQTRDMINNENEETA
ncbi:probable N-acetylglutamate synthase [hydrothermal vent metagenome]|uniref:Probable N-acetylglutamate synthase n=1 Tax=hydrothermal vent metagenome TaxID=652676 RepID=A0A3B1E801_9ZZZZ